MVCVRVELSMRTTIVECLRHRRKLIGARLGAQPQSQRVPKQERFGLICVAPGREAVRLGRRPPPRSSGCKSVFIPCFIRGSISKIFGW